MTIAKKFDPVGLLTKMRTESDRTSAILGAALLDHLLEHAFKTRLVPDRSAGIFDFRSPLGDFASKIEMAHAVGWIDTPTGDDFTTIRKIRNDFSHDVDHERSLSDSSYLQRLNSLSVSKVIDDRFQRLAAATGLDSNATEVVTTTHEALRLPKARFRLAVTILAGVAASIAQDPPQTNASAHKAEDMAGTVLDSLVGEMKTQLLSAE
jgi:hypothetical protein